MQGQRFPCDPLCSAFEKIFIQKSDKKNGEKDVFKSVHIRAWTGDELCSHDVRISKWGHCFLTRPPILHYNSPMINCYYSLYSRKCFIHVVVESALSLQHPLSLTTVLKRLSNVFLLNTVILLNGIIIAQFIVEVETFIDLLPLHLSLTLPKPRAPSRPSAVPR